MPEIKNEQTLDESIDLSFITRRWRWILASFCFIALATAAVALRLPNRYTSEATLVVVQQQVAERYVETGITMTAADAVRALTHQILSRARLLEIIDQLDLYANERQGVTAEALAERMRMDMVIEPIEDGPGRSDVKALRIAFMAETPQLAQAVTGRLTSRFIEENKKARGDQAARTTNFLTEQLEASKRKLAEQEQRLQNFRMGNLRELPEHQQANLGMLSDLRMQLQSTVGNLSRAQQQRASLESVISGNLTVLQSQLTNLLTRFTPRHPDVIKKNQEVATMQALLSRLKSGGSSDAGVSDDPSVTQLRAQVDANTSDIATYSQEEKRLRTEMVTYQSRLNLAPLREQQLTEILRDYEIYKKEYSDFLNKQLQSRLTVSLEEKQEGQQFRLVDPPTLPTTPTSPKRLKISVVGAGVGLIAGIALAFLIDLKKSCFYSEKDLRQNFTAPLIVGVPVLVTPSERRRNSWKATLEFIAVSAMTLAVFFAEFYIFRHG